MENGPSPCACPDAKPRDRRVPIRSAVKPSCHGEKFGRQQRALAANISKLLEPRFRGRCPPGDRKIATQQYDSGRRIGSRVVKRTNDEAGAQSERDMWPDRLHEEHVLSEERALRLAVQAHESP